MLEVNYGFNVLSSTNNSEDHSPSDIDERKSIFHLVKTRDKQKLIEELSVKKNVYNPSELDEYGEVPLMVACKHKRTANAFTLLDFYGELSSPGFISADGLSTIYYSITSVNLTERLLTYKSVLLTLEHVFPCGNNILTLLLSRNIVQNVSQIVDNISTSALNFRNKSGKTALIMLACLGEYQLCRKLILKGANTQIYDNDGKTVITYLMEDIEKNIIKERIDLCLMCFERENNEKRNLDFKNFSSSDFDLMGTVTLSDVVSTYGEMKWVMDSDGNVKIIKFFKTYKGTPIIPEDLVKELVYIKEIKCHSNNVVNVQGTYVDVEGNIHLVFEPLAMTMRDYFYLLNLYSTIDSSCSTMSKMRIEIAYKKLRETLCVIHNLGYLHNDIKLNNIMIGYDGHVRFIDFGISNFIGFSPYERVVNTYMTTTNIKAPDYDRKIIVNFMKRVENNSFGAVRSIAFDSSRKSYNSDIYSFSVSIIQGILGNSKRYICFDSNIYEVLALKKSTDKDLEHVNKKKKSEETIDLIQITDLELAKLKKYKFFDSLKQGVNLDSNSRTDKKKDEFSTNFQITNFKHSNSLLSHRIHIYTDDDLKNSKYEIANRSEIFNCYQNMKINVLPGRNSSTVASIFERLIKILDRKISIDTYYNAIYHSVNYNGTCDMKVVCVAYMYIFSHLLERQVLSIDKISTEFDIPVGILTGNVNSMISSLVTNIKIIPFILIVENMMLKCQYHGVPSSSITNIERVIFDNLLSYISGKSEYVLPGKDIYIWDFVQCFSYSVCSFLPFEIAYESETILELFQRFN